MFQCRRSPRSITITTPNIFQRALYIQNIQIGNWQDWFSNSLLFYTECLNNLDGICYYKCCIQPKHEDHHRSTLLGIRDIPKYPNASKNFFPLLSFSLFLQLAFYNYLLILHIYSLLILQSFSEYFETFWCFTKFSFHQKWDDMRLLLKNMVYMSCLTSWRTTLDLRKLGNIKKVSKPHGMTF